MRSPYGKIHTGLLLASSFLLLFACDGEVSGDDGGPVLSDAGQQDAGQQDAGTADAQAPVSPLLVVGDTPEAGATDVPLDSTVSVTFDRELDPASIGERSIVVAAAGEALAGQLTASATTLTMVLPTLRADTEYSVRVSTDVRGLDGAILAEEHAFTFSTGQTFADGTRPRGDNYLPLGCTFGFAPKVEYMLIGLDDTNNVQLRDPLEYNSPEPPVDPSADLLYAETNTALVTSANKRSAAGAIDRDFQDEVVAISWSALGTGTLTLIDRNDEGSSSSILSADLSIDGRPEQAYQYDIVLADVDGDCLDEILVAGVVAGDTGAERLGKVWVLDDAVGSHALLHTIDFIGEFDPSSGYVGLDRIAIEAGRLDDDSPEEIVVAFHLLDQEQMSLMVFDDADAGYAQLGHQRVRSSNSVELTGPSSERMIRLATGDPDSDRRDEILVGWATLNNGWDGCSSGFVMVDDVSEGLTTLAELGLPWCGSHDFAAGQLSRAVAFADLNGDHADEIVAFGQLWTYEHYRDEPVLVPLSDAGLCESDMDFGFGYEFEGSALAIGDVNGDERDDLIILNRGQVLVRGCVAHPHYDPDTGELRSITNHMEQIDLRGEMGTWDQALIEAVNVDQDSVVLGLGAIVPNPDAEPPGPGEPQPVRFEEHSVYFADNRIIAVVAAPPCAEGIGQNTDSCSAGFGTSSGGSTSEGLTVAARAGVLVGISFELQVGFLFGTTTVAKVEAEVASQVELSGFVSRTMSHTTTITNTTGFDQDLVVFAATPYDRYVYGVRSAPDGDIIGRTVVIDVPQESRVFTVSRTYYNATNGRQRDIGPVVLRSRPGDLSSYPRRREVSGYLDAPNESLGQIGPVTVNQGSGSQSLERELASEMAIGGDLTFSIDSMAKTCGSVVCGGITSGFSIGATFETTFNEGTLFMSEVGGIDAEHFAAERYDYGTFAYRTTFRDPNGDIDQNFVVVNHWVD